MNALYVWGVARATGGEVVLRIEDHDRTRSRPAFDAALLDDLDRLGLIPDRPSLAALRAHTPDVANYRQSTPASQAAYLDALERLRAEGRVYACACARSDFERWERTHGAPFAGPGCPRGCREAAIAGGPGTGVRVALGAGRERWLDLLAGPLADDATPAGDLLARNRDGDWTYGFCVVVDDLRHGIGLVIRGRDLLHATAQQLRLARLLGRETLATFLHHPLIRRPDGSKLSKADGDTAVAALLDAGRRPAELFGEAAAAVGLGDGSPIDDPAALFA